MATDATAVGDREAGLNQRRQLVHHVVVHAVVRSPRLLAGIQVEAGTVTEIPGAVRIARHLGAARTGIRRDQHQPQLGGQALRAGLLHEVLVGAGQAGQPVQHRQLRPLPRLRRQIDGEHHVALQGGRVVTVAMMPAAEAFLAGEQFEGHGWVPGRRVRRG
ncbi:hypothetical protein D3C84_708480 [compost metagenome]